MATLGEQPDFTYVLIPADSALPLVELTAKAASFGDTLTELLKKQYAGGALTNMDTLRAEYGGKIDDKIGDFQAHADKGSVEVLALVKPSKTNLPHPMTGTYLYMDEMGALKDRPPNTRAFAMAKTCGLDMEHPLPGDCFIGRVAIEPQMQSVSFLASEFASSAAWCLQAPAENAQYNAALSCMNSLKEKQIGYMTDAEKDARDVEQGYTWSQTEDEVEITVAVPEGTTSKAVQVAIASTSLKVTLKSDPSKALVDFKFFAAVRADDSTWTIGKDKKMGAHVQVTLEKVDGTTWSRLEHGNK